LDGSRTGEATFLEAARAVRLAVEILKVLRAQKSEAPLELLQVFFAENVVFAYVGTLGHSGRLYNIRLLFANELKSYKSAGSDLET
jgi:hypothetical protein